MIRHDLYEDVSIVLSSLTDIHESITGNARLALGSLGDQAEALLAAGWKRQDVVAYLRNCEEVNPTLREDIALANMRKIAATLPPIK